MIEMMVARFDGGALQPQNEETTMLDTTDKIIKHKTGLLNLAEELGNVSKACQVMHCRAIGRNVLQDAQS
ncbi:hypothetical protein [Pseudophaeobacter sp. EL27]|uniref:hypothetical protein n=1 Tax=Pseudophaeobacter sp. EL27 TaxID=2107580 RepID=UPI000EFCA019|nr:hypothetical protein [Pseudophaeobacter sp. EL27]